MSRQNSIEPRMPEIAVTASGGVILKAQHPFFLQQAGQVIQSKTR